VTGASVLRHDGGALVAELAARPPDDEMRVFWLGQSGFAVRYRDECLLVDPYLSDSLTKKYANTDRPHVRLRPRVVAPEALADVPITAIAATHHHTDHLDPETLTPLVAALAARGMAVPLVAPEAWRELAAERAGLEPAAIVGIDEHATARAGAFEIVALAAAHETIEYTAGGHRKCLGYVLRTAAGTIFHSGDTLLYDELASRLRPFAPDLALLPINGKVGNMSGAEAARLAKEAGAALVVPCHYDMFAFNSADPAEAFVPECERLGQPYVVLTLGESVTVSRRRDG
jgi:L-ascorbate metabolism protein UlaG (beta-lactamase superfamily)